MATAQTVDYDDKRFAEVEADKQGAMAELEQTYDGMIDKSDSFYQAQIDASKEWADKQGQLQQEQTDFAIEQIQQQKDQAERDYTKEQSGAYKDWQKQSNQYGANAEAMAAQGMDGTGYSESAQVSMYNAYQNRVATARESFKKAVLNYDNAMTEARMQNNAALAEIAANALQQQLELALSGFQYKNQLLLDKVDKKTTMDQMYYNRYQDVLAQINQEKAMAEEIRQYNEKMAEEKRQYDESLAEEKRQYEQNYALKMKEYEESIRQYNEEMARAKENDKLEYELKLEEMQHKKAQLEEEKRQFDLSLEASKEASKATIEKNDASIEKETHQASEEDTLRSVLELGYGPLSASELAKKIESGEVILNDDGTVSKGRKLDRQTDTISKKNAAEQKNAFQKGADMVKGAVQKIGMTSTGAFSPVSQKNAPLRDESQLENVLRQLPEEDSINLQAALRIKDKEKRKNAVSTVLKKCGLGQYLDAVLNY